MGLCIDLQEIFLLLYTVKGTLLKQQPCTRKERRSIHSCSWLVAEEQLKENTDCFPAIGGRLIAMTNEE